MLTTAAQLCVRNLKENLHFIYFYAMFKPLISRAEKRRAKSLLTIPTPSNPLIFSSAPRVGRQVRNGKNQLIVLHICFPPWKQQASYCFPKSRVYERSDLYFYITFTIIYVPTIHSLFLSLTAPKIMEDGKENRNKIIWCSFNISFFLESHLRCVWKFLFNCRRYTLLTDYLEVNVKGDRLIIL